MCEKNKVFLAQSVVHFLQNIDFMPTILSRFDTIFIVKDEHNQAKDMVRTIACMKGIVYCWLYEGTEILCGMYRINILKIIFFP